MSTPRKRTIIIVLSEFDRQMNPTGSALRDVSAELNEMSEQLGTDSSLSTAVVQAGIPEPDSHRDRKTEERVIERTQSALEGMYERLRDRLTSAGDTVKLASMVGKEIIVETKKLVDESVVDASVEAYLSLSDATEAVREMWRKSCPSSDEIVKDCIKYAIRGVVFYGLWKMMG